MMRVAVAASSQLAADAGVEIAERGGNAVDAAIASSLVQLVTEPGVVSLAAGAFMVIWPPGEKPVMVDAAAEMPGREAAPELFGRGGIDTILPYGGGTPTTVGYGSVATPGAIAGYELAAQRYGCLPWPVLLEPAVRHAREGFPMPRASAQYLATTAEGIFGWNPDAFAPLCDENGQLIPAGETVRLADLSASLELIAEEGARAFYEGDIAHLIVAAMAANEGLLGAADLAAYEPRIVDALEVGLDDWHLATAAAPSLGGAALAAMLLLMQGSPHRDWSVALTEEVVNVQRVVMDYRQKRLDTSRQLQADVEQLLATARSHPSALRSP